MSLADEMRRIQSNSLNTPKLDLYDIVFQSYYNDFIIRVRQIAQGGNSSGWYLASRYISGGYESESDSKQREIGPLYTIQEKKGFINSYVTVNLTDLGKRFFYDLKARAENDGFKIVISPCFHTAFVGPKLKFNFNEKTVKDLKNNVGIVVLVEFSF